MTGSSGLRIVLFNAWHNDNKGDAAITLGTIDLLVSAYPGCDITVVSLTESRDPAEDSMRHLMVDGVDVTVVSNPVPTELRGRRNARPWIDLPIWFVRLIPHLARHRGSRVSRRLEALVGQADLVVGVGGSNIYTDESVAGIVSMARLFTLLVPIQAAVTRRVPTIMLGHTIGPFPPARPRSAALARSVLSEVDLVTVRDPASLDVVARLGVTDAVLAPDMAYAIRPHTSHRVRTILNSCDVSPSRVLVVALRRHPSEPRTVNERMQNEIRTAVARLHDHGLIDHVLVVAHTMGPTEIEDDRIASTDTFDRIRASRPQTLGSSYVDADLSPRELAGLYGAVGGMIAVRLHAAILAMISGTPTFAISYFSSKTAGVMSLAGLTDSTADFATVTGAHISRSLGAQMTNPSARTTLATRSRSNAAVLARHIAQWSATPERHHDTHSTGESA